MGPVEEVVAVQERETVSQVMTPPCRLGAVIASLTTATNGKVDTEHVATLATQEDPLEKSSSQRSKPALPKRPKYHTIRADHYAEHVGVMREHPGLTQSMDPLSSQALRPSNYRNSRRT